VTRAAGIGCATASQSRGLAADCKAKPQGNPFERRTSARGSAFNVRQIDPRTDSVGDREPCRRAFGSKKVSLNFLSSVDIGERSNAHPVREIESISTTPMMLPFGE